MIGLLDYKPSLVDYEQMKEAINHQQIAKAADLRMLYSASLIQPYNNDNETIQEEIRKGFTGMKGSWRDTLLRMLQFIIYGFSLSEFAFKVTSKKAILKTINTLNQARSNFVVDNKKGITHIGYGSVKIPYENIIHLTNQGYLSTGYNPYGLASLSRAMPYYQLHKVCMAAMAIASDRQATPFIAVKTDTTHPVPVTNADGTEKVDSEGNVQFQSRVNLIDEQLSQTENTSHLVIDRLDDVFAVAQQTDGQFFRRVLAYLDQAMLWSFLISPIIAGQNETGVGDSSLVDGHLTVLSTTAKSQMVSFGDTVIEQIVKPWIIFNHGEQDDYGSFPVVEEESEDSLKLLEIIGRVASSGILSTEDEAVINKVKQLAGIED